MSAVLVFGLKLIKLVEVGDLVRLSWLPKWHPPGAARRRKPFAGHVEGGF